MSDPHRLDHDGHQLYRIDRKGDQRKVRGLNGETIGWVKATSRLSKTYNKRLNYWSITTKTEWCAMRVDGSSVLYSNGAPKFGALRFWRSPSAWK